MIAIDPACANCLYWATTNGEAATEGLCRIHPPVAALTQDSEVWTIWPSTDDTDWCGEWEAGDQGVSMPKLAES